MQLPLNMILAVTAYSYILRVVCHPLSQPCLPLVVFFSLLCQDPTELHRPHWMDSCTGMMTLAHLRLIPYAAFTNFRPARVYKPLICPGGRNDQCGLGLTLMLDIGLPTTRYGSQPALPKSGLAKHDLRALHAG